MAQPLVGLDMHKITTPILTELLRTELRFPTLFLINRFKKRVDVRFPAELIELAALPLWLYIYLKKRIGQQKAFEIMRVAILTGGIAQCNFAYRTDQKERTFENLCDAEMLVDRNGPTRWNTLELVERSERRFEIKITRCLR